MNNNGSVGSSDDTILGITSPSDWCLHDNIITLPKLNHFGWKYDESDRSVDANFMDLAYRLARNSYCVEGNMGCVYVRDIPQGSGQAAGPTAPRGTIVAESINSALVQRFHSECHAEANAVSACCRHGVSLAGTTCYVTRAPCTNCYRLIATAGVSRIVCPHDPASENCTESARKLGIEWIKLSPTNNELRIRDEEASKYEDTDRIQLLRKERKIVREEAKIKSRKRKAERQRELEQKQRLKMHTE